MQEKAVWRKTTYVKWFYNRLKNLSIPRNFISMAEWCKRHGYRGLSKMHSIAYKAHHNKERTAYLDYVRKNTVYEKVKRYGRGGGIGFIRKDFPIKGFTELFKAMCPYKGYITLSDFCARYKLDRLSYTDYQKYLPKGFFLRIKIKKNSRTIVRKDTPYKGDEIITGYLMRLKKEKYTPFNVAYKQAGISRQAANQKLQAGQVDGCCKIRNRWYIPDRNLHQLTRKHNGYQKKTQGWQG